MKGTSEYTNYSNEERYKKKQERIAFKRSYAAELAALKAQMDRVTSDLERTQSQMHHRTGKAPAVAQEAEKDIVYCKLFGESLKGHALQWFYKLEKNSVHTFLQLSELFVQHYNIFMERKIYDSELWNNKQGETESLRSFMKKFKNTLSKVEDTLHRAADFARTKEEVRAGNGGKAKQAREPAHAANLAYVQYEEGSGGVHNYRVESSGYEEPKEYDEELYCDFHKANGHSTAKCRELGQQLIAKLTGGTLKGNVSLSDFKPEEEAPVDTEQQEDISKCQRRDDGMENEDQHEIINMIMGGSSVDVIFKKTLERMKIDLFTIKGIPKYITGFSGETTITMATIRLPVQAGNVKKMVDFTVSDHPAIYNMIMGLLGST
ncbi:hypothetical protein AALP_AAs50696U000100 [Arabis alpina]|uniref:Retrotransposon gag domain-containing protein n=1 Tax=Arabis alpina TaxID=50452 RepID=A0A087FY05_ARAAL|nr:hypothetical protein AALP_AAs50696U000100 [Arabis alpina]